MHDDESKPTPTERTSGNPPDWFWILAFPLATAVRYLVKLDDLSTIASIAWWVASFVGSLVVLWVVWEIGKRIRSS